MRKPSRDTPIAPEPVVLFSIPAERSAPKSGNDDERCEQQRREIPWTKQLAQEPAHTSNKPHHRATGSTLPIDRVPILPILEFRTVGPDLNLPESTGQPENLPKWRGTALTVAVVKATSGRLRSTYDSYTAQVLKSPTSTTGVSRMSSVSTEASLMSVGTTLDYSFFTVPPQNEYAMSQQYKTQARGSNFGSRNPEKRPEQKSTRRFKTHIISPHGASFAVARKSHRSNGRGPARPTLARSFHPSPGNSRMIGNMANIHVFSTRAQRVQVIRPLEKPVIIGIFPVGSQAPRKRVPKFPNLQVSSVEGCKAVKPITLPPQDVVATLTTVPNNSATFSPRELVPQLPTTPSSIPDRINIRWLETPPPLGFTKPHWCQESQLAELRPVSLPSSAAELSPLSPLQQKEAMVNAGQSKKGGIPESLRIGNKENSSLFQRLTSLESLEAILGFELS